MSMILRAQGLKQRPTYDQVLGSVLRGSGGGIDFALPDRTATFIRQPLEYQNLLTNNFIDSQKTARTYIKTTKERYYCQRTIIWLIWFIAKICTSILYKWGIFGIRDSSIRFQFN